MGQIPKSVTIHYQSSFHHSSAFSAHLVVQFDTFTYANQTLRTRAADASGRSLQEAKVPGSVNPTHNRKDQRNNE
jgi:hypothetical protein